MIANSLKYPNVVKKKVCHDLYFPPTNNILSVLNATLPLFRGLPSPPSPPPPLIQKKVLIHFWLKWIKITIITEQTSGRKNEIYIHQVHGHDYEGKWEMVHHPRPKCIHVSGKQNSREASYVSECFPPRTCGRVCLLVHVKAEPVLPPAACQIARPVLQQQSSIFAKINHRQGKAY